MLYFNILPVKEDVKIMLNQLINKAVRLYTVTIIFE